MNQPVSTEVFSGLQRRNAETALSPLEFVCEEIDLQGFSVIPDVISEEQRQLVAAEIDRLEKADKMRWTAEALKQINDYGVVRNPFLSSNPISEACFCPATLDVCRAIFGSQYILHVNRAVINDPEHDHPASIWHREPPYQNFTTSKPLALTFVLAIDETNEATGGLRVLVGSHHWETVPSDAFIRKNALWTTVPPRALLVFNSALLHASSRNRTKKRRSLVTIFSSPLIKQQTLITEMLRRDPQAMQQVSKIPGANFIFGLETDPSPSDDAYRQMKIDKNIKIY